MLSTITQVYRNFGYRRIETPPSRPSPAYKADRAARTKNSSTRSCGEVFRRASRSTPRWPTWSTPRRAASDSSTSAISTSSAELTVLAEAELIEATTAALTAVGLNDMTVRLSDRRFLTILATAAGLPESSWDHFFIILDKLDQIGWDGARTELDALGLPAAAITRTLEVIERLQEVPAASSSVPSLILCRASTLPCWTISALRPAVSIGSVNTAASEGVSTRHSCGG
ncbi:hypothetical protein AB0M34_30360 [Nocardia sp. NPDC050193]